MNSQAVGLTASTGLMTLFWVKCALSRHGGRTHMACVYAVVAEVLLYIRNPAKLLQLDGNTPMLCRGRDNTTHSSRFFQLQRRWGTEKTGPG